MLSIFCNLRQHKLQVIECIQCVQPSLQFSTSSQILNSGKFRKVKPATATFLSRSSKKPIEKKLNPLFEHDYIDRQVDKLLQGKVDLEFCTR